MTTKFRTVEQCANVILLLKHYPQPCTSATIGMRTCSCFSSGSFIHHRRVTCHDWILKKSCSTIMEIPKWKKLVLNTSSKLTVSDRKYLIPGLASLELISGRKLKITTAKKSIAGFLLRENQLIGCKVTLRKTRIHGFLDQLLLSVFPSSISPGRTKISKLDQKGNYNFGFHNLLDFPELENYFEFFQQCRGCNASLICGVGKRQDAVLLLSSNKIPFK